MADLTCSNNKGETVPCPNGFCQLSTSGSTILDRKCVPQGNGVNPSGVLVGLTNFGESVSEETVVYACNKPMCNGIETGGKVRSLLYEYKLVNTNELVASTTTTTTTTTATTAKPSKNKAHLMMDNFPSTILFILSSLLTIVSMWFQFQKNNTNRTFLSKTLLKIVYLQTQEKHRFFFFLIFQYIHIPFDKVH